MRDVRWVLVAVALAGCGESAAPPGRPAAPPPAPAADAGDPPQAAARASRPPEFVALSHTAADEVRRRMRETPGAKYLRVSVGGDGYKLDLDDKADPATDLIGESRGVPLATDRASARDLPAGVTVDYFDEPGRKGFAFHTPAPAQGPADASVTLAEARKGFRTKVARRVPGGGPAPAPPAGVMRLVRYPSPAGRLAAYLTPAPRDGKKRPAIIWVHGGDCNSIGGSWVEGPPENDQSASAYRKAGVVMMFPSLRGGNDNPGVKEGFFGEVDDVVAAAEYLRTVPYVDPERVYLGGHSTGGTLALLAAECSARFRAVFSFGPVADVAGYGPRSPYNPFSPADPEEFRLRATGRWLHGVRVPVFVFEGGRDGNEDDLRAMARASKNPRVRFFEVKGADHFTVLAPTNRLIAAKILRDAGPECGLTFTQAEVDQPFAR